MGPRRRYLLLGCLATQLLAVGCASHSLNPAAKNDRIYLSGKDRDSAVPWEFFCTANRKSGEWTTLKVPSCWDVEGFGNLAYYDDSDKLPVEQGKYRHTFGVPADWKTRRVFIVFDGVMTDADVRVNGKSAGPVHQGAFYRFKYDVTDLVHAGDDNLLEVTVSKRSANESVNRAERKADYWIFGGIFRPVYLEAVPAQHVERTAIDARADGSFAIDVYANGATTADSVEVALLDAKGKIVATSRAPLGPATRPTRVTASVDRPALWTAETPNLYAARISLKAGATLLHETTQRFGFRTIELRRGDGLYVNGTRVMLKGVNRHAAWPDSGRTLTPAIDRMDIGLIKGMNMNAVRMSHYPPDESFLELCDELGLYVINELAGWQKSYDTPTATRLVGELIVRDVNHPSVVMWANGNEGGWNTAVDGEYAKWDPQRRQVIHPWGIHEGLDTKHYPKFDLAIERLKARNVFMPTEFLHALYDGGAGAGLRDYWDAMRASKTSAGGFIWVFADEGVRRIDDKKKADDKGRLDVAGNAAPDGIVGPYREKEGSYETVRKIWSPVVLPATLPADFDGSLPVENAYDFTSLKDVQFKWKLLGWPAAGADEIKVETLASGPAASPDVAPHASGTLKLMGPSDARLRRADAISVVATDATGHEIATWTYAIARGGLPAPSVVEARSNGGRSTVLTSGDTTMTLDPQTQAIVSLVRDGKPFPLTGGPRLALGVRTPNKPATTAAAAPATVQVATTAAPLASGKILRTTWSPGRDGWFKLECEYEADGPCDYLGISFDLPEAGVRSATWLGAGPSRVWQNRLEGPTLGVWTAAVNDSITGWSGWQYPEFKGYFADLRWTRIQTDAGTLTIAPETPGLYLQRFTPSLPPGDLSRTAKAPFPAAGISLLHAIAPIGTKFSTAEQEGPQGQPYQARGTYRTVAWFRVQKP